MKRFILVLMVVGTALALSAGVALAQATTETTSRTVPFTIVFDNPCTGEPVLLTGELHQLFHITLDANGGLHLQLHSNPQGVSGVALVTGREYRAVGVNRLAVNIPAEGARETTFVNNFKVISTDQTDNYLLHTTIHVTFNANVEPTATVTNVEVKCAG